MANKLIERLINKEYLTERERKEWLRAIKERLEALEAELDMARTYNDSLFNENDKFKKIINDNFGYSKATNRVFFNYDAPVMEDEIKEVLVNE